MKAKMTILVVAIMLLVAGVAKDLSSGLNQRNIPAPRETETLPYDSSAIPYCDPYCKP
jgi:hypothetical protein